MLLLGNRDETCSEHRNKFLVSNLTIDGHSSTDVLIPADIDILITEVGQHCCTSQCMTFGAKFIGFTPSIQYFIIATVTVNSTASRTVQFAIFSTELLVGFFMGFAGLTPILLISCG